MKAFFEGLGVDPAKLDEIGKLPEAEQGPAYTALADQVKKGAYEVAQNDPEFRKGLEKAVFNDARKAAFGEYAERISAATGLPKDKLMDPKTAPELLKGVMGNVEEVKKTMEGQILELQTKATEWEQKAMAAEQQFKTQLSGIKRDYLVKDLLTGYAPKLGENTLGIAESHLRTKLSVIEVGDDGKPVVNGLPIPKKTGVGTYASVGEWATDHLEPELSPLFKKSSGEGAGSAQNKPALTPGLNGTAAGQNGERKTFAAPRI